MARLCPRCKTRHAGNEIMACNKAYLALMSGSSQPILKVVHASDTVVHKAPVVVHKETVAEILGDLLKPSRHGKYKDVDARKAYRRKWMRARRAK